LRITTRKNATDSTDGTDLSSNMLPVATGEVRGVLVSLSIDACAAPYDAM
jgi:hypothetical protein